MEPDHAHECCGFGGTFAVKQPEISAAMAADKADAILATGAQVLVSQDWWLSAEPGRHPGAPVPGLGRQPSPRPAVKHIAELLWERTHES